MVVVVGVRVGLRCEIDGLDSEVLVSEHIRSKIVLLCRMDLSMLLVDRR